MDTALMDSLELLGNPEKDLYQSFSPDEEIRRVSYHYEINPRFFEIVTGGLWNTYSCNIWRDGFTLTQAQEYKLNKFARLADLRPGSKVLDVGCGWGGPLVYLSKQFGIEGKGITISPKAIPIANKRATKHNANVEFAVCHWRDLPERQEYDAIITDEVIVHFNDLEQFFKKCRKLLKPGGTLVNKELHFKHSAHAHAHDKLSQHINKVYGYSGNYRTLSDELLLLNNAGFSLQEIVDIDIDNYIATISQHWLSNLIENKRELITLTSDKHVRDFQLYLRGIVKIFKADVFGLHMVSSKSM